MTSRTAPLRAALVAAATLAGLFAMHGLTHHGEHLPTTHTAHAAAEHTMTSAAPDSSHTGAGAMAMCLSMLLAGTLAVAAVRRPRAALPLRIPRALLVGSRERPTTRAHDPPTPWSLSVCRC